MKKLVTLSPWRGFVWCRERRFTPKSYISLHHIRPT